MTTTVKTDKEITLMREGGRMLASILAKLASIVEAGISTKELALIASTELTKMGGKPAFLGYFGFPDVLCVSINDEVVHGIPSPSRILKKDDIVGLDFGVNYDGMITDAAISVIVGNSGDQKLKNLLDTTERSLAAGISVIKNGVHVGDVSNAVQKVLDKKHLGIVRDLVGHGVGHNVHEKPDIPNYGKKGTGPILETGMTIAIEPMATMGGYEVYTDQDKWTVKTRDGSRSAHFEHTVLITNNGSEILTTL